MLRRSRPGHGGWREGRPPPAPDPKGPHSVVGIRPSPTHSVYRWCPKKKQSKKLPIETTSSIIVSMINEENKSHPILSLLFHYLILSHFSFSWFLYRHGVLHEKPCPSFSSLTHLLCDQISYVASSLMLWKPT